MDFHEKRFPEKISYGATGGPKFNTTVIEMASGYEQRNINWKDARCEYNVSQGLKSEEDYQELLTFFYERKGKAHGFRFKDWSDYKIIRQKVVFDSNNNYYQIYKAYDDNYIEIYKRVIKKLVTGTVFISFLPGRVPAIASDSISLQPNSNISVWTIHSSDNTMDFTINYNTGIITGIKTATSTPITQDLYITCEFDVPVRFDVDDMKGNIEYFNTLNWDNIGLVEVRL